MVKFEVIVKDVDYGEIIYKILPDILASMKDKEDASKIIQILAGMSGVPGTIAKAALSVLPQDVKDDLVIKVIDGYSDELREKLNEFCKDKQYPLEIKEIWAAKA